MKYLIATLFCFIFNVTDTNAEIFKDSFETLVCVEEVVYEENFNLVDQTGWPGMWQESGNSSEVIEVSNNQARLIPISPASPYPLARMKHPLSEANVEATFSLVFEDATSQGVGFYVRSNGGYLTHTNPMGQGYAVFIERFSNDESRLGLWYEHDGDETAFIRQPEISAGVFYDFIDETKYLVKFQVFQETPTTTRLRAKIWQDGLTEPVDWGVSHLDNYPVLQNLADGIAIDSFHTSTSLTITDAIRIDDIVITRICP